MLFKLVDGNHKQDARCITANCMAQTVMSDFPHSALVSYSQITR